MCIASIGGSICCKELVMILFPVYVLLSPSCHMFCEDVSYCWNVLHVSICMHVYCMHVYMHTYIHTVI